MFSFGSTPATTTASTGSTSTSATPGFSFGSGASSGAPSSGLGFGAAKPGGGTGFNFGAPASANTAVSSPPATGFSFGGPPAKASNSTPAPSNTSFSFNLGGSTAPPANTLAPGAANPATAANPSGFSFGSLPGAVTGTAAKPPAFGAASTPANAAAAASTTPATTAALSFGTATPFGAAPATTATLSFGTATPAATSAAASTTPSSKRGLSFGLTTTTAAATTPATGFSFGAVTTTTAAAALTTAATTTTTGFGITPAVTATTVASVAPTTSTPAVSAATPNVSLSTTTKTTPAAAASASMNYRQLEESINKWTLELEEQEKIFLNQATQVNAWDRLLMSNGEKIITLNEQVEKVKLDQQRLEHELDFIKGQQSELEEILRPLESSLNTSDTSGPPPDTERERTYQLAETMDAQLQRMSEDLKEIIEHLNSANRHQDSNDPIVQIGRVLNAHMDSLQWIDQSTSQVQRKLDEVSKIYEIRKKDNERTTGIVNY